QRRHAGRDVGYLAERLVRPAPPVVARDAQARREVPVRSGAGDLLRDSPADPLCQGRIPGRPEPDVVRVDGRAEDVVVTVYRVHAVDQWDAQRSGQGTALEVVVHV